MTKGVASTQGSQDTSSVAKSGRAGGGVLCSACTMSTVWLASNSAPADQIATIQRQPLDLLVGTELMAATVRQPAPAANPTCSERPARCSRRSSPAPVLHLD